MGPANPAVIFSKSLQPGASYLCASLVGAIPPVHALSQTVFRPQMHDIDQSDRRRQDRIQAVLPVRVRGVDTAGVSFDELAHTLDLTPTGVRLGAIRHQVRALDTLIIFYHQRRMEFKVVWTRLLEGTKEYQVGLKAFSQQQEAWGLFHSKAQQMGRASTASVTA
jgi:hypothetical protein